MKNFLPIILPYTALYQCLTPQSISIRYKKNFKECFFSFKPENRLLKKIYLISIVKETGHSNAEAIVPGENSTI